jgi:hypothetical protein
MGIALVWEKFRIHITHKSITVYWIYKNKVHIGCQWPMPVILGTQEAEIRRITGSKPA